MRKLRLTEGKQHPRASHEYVAAPGLKHGPDSSPPGQPTHTHSEPSPPPQFRQVTDLEGRLVGNSQAPECICDPTARCSCHLLTAPALHVAGRGTGPRLWTPNLGTNPLWLAGASCSQTSVVPSGLAPPRVVLGQQPHSTWELIRNAGPQTHWTC